MARAPVEALGQHPIVVKSKEGRESENDDDETDGDNDDDDIVILLDMIILIILTTLTTLCFGFAFGCVQSGGVG